MRQDRFLLLISCVKLTSFNFISLLNIFNDRFKCLDATVMVLVLYILIKILSCQFALKSKDLGCPFLLLEEAQTVWQVCGLLLFASVRWEIKYVLVVFGLKSRENNFDLYFYPFLPKESPHPPALSHNFPYPLLP